MYIYHMLYMHCANIIHPQDFICVSCYQAWSIFHVCGWTTYILFNAMFGLWNNVINNYAVIKFFDCSFRKTWFMKSFRPQFAKLVKKLKICSNRKIFLFRILGDGTEIIWRYYYIIFLYIETKYRLIYWYI